MLRHILILFALLLLLAGALAALLGVREVRAEGLGDDAQPAPTLLEELGTPARERAVYLALRRSLREGRPALVALAEALGQAGGCAAHHGATRLLRLRDPAVRVAALGALERIGLRSGPAASAVWRLAAEGEGAERLAAVAALGVVGDGRDVDLLLLLAGSDEEDERRAAFAALRVLADVPIPSVHGRWAWHWRTLEGRVGASLARALERLDAEPDGPASRSLLAEIGRDAWVDIESVDEYLVAWLRDGDPARRRNACRLAAELRLADHGLEVVRVHTLSRDGDEVALEAARAVRVLGAVHWRKP